MSGRGAFDDRVLSDIRASADIVAVIGEHTTLKKAGRSWKGLCPFHREKTPSFTVDRDRGLYYCFGCGAGGDLFGFVRQIERVDFPEAVRILARRAGVPLPEQAPREEIDRREKLASAVARAARLYAENLWSAGAAAREYLAGRGVPEEIARRMELGYAPDSWDFLAQALSREFPPGLLVEAGLLQPGAEGKRPYDRFRHRLLFPIRDERGRVVAFGGRALGEEEPKYLNSPETPIFAKGRTLYGLSSARDAMRRAERAVLVEGYFDHLALVLSDIGETVATMGTALTSSHAERLRRAAEKIVVCYDGDAAGRNAARRAIPLLLAAGASVGVARLPAGLDPFDVFRESGAEAVRRCVDSAAPFLPWLIEESAVADPGLAAEEKGSRLRAILETLDQVGDRVVRYEHVRTLAASARVPIELLWRAGAPSGARRPDPPPASAPAPTAPFPAGEERLLALLLQRGAGAAAAGEIDPELFSDPRLRKIYSTLLGAGLGSAELDFPVLASHLNDWEERQLLSRLALEEIPSQPEADIFNLLRQLERRRREREAARLQREIEAAEAAGDWEQLDRLNRSKLALARQARDATRQGGGRKAQE